MKFDIEREIGVIQATIQRLSGRLELLQAIQAAIGSIEMPDPGIKIEERKDAKETGANPETSSKKSGS